MSIKTVDCKTLKKWLENNEAILVDVRTGAEHKSQNIKEAKSIPLDEICKNKLPNHLGKKLVIHCQKGKRGGAACEKLLQEDPDLEIYNLEGGLDAWQQVGQEVKSSGKKILPLERQVQLVIGLGVFLSGLLGYFVNANFSLLAAIFGLGLTFAGLTGFCGLALLIGKCPWNKN